MNKFLLIIFLALGLSAILFGEIEDEVINAKFRTLSKEQVKQELVIRGLINDLENKSAEIDSLKLMIRANSSRLDSTRTNIMNVVEDNREHFEGEFQTSHKEMSKRTKVILGIIAGTLLMAALSYLLLRKKMMLQGKQLSLSISETRKAHDEEAVKLDNQLIDLIGKQLDLFQRYRPEGNQSGETDHSLVLKIANEIIRIQQNLDHMDESIKGHKQLSRATQSILNNLKTEGYDIPPLLGTPFDKNLNMIATMELDDSLAQGTSIIKRVVKPMVKFNGTMIQAAEVYVGFND